MVPLPEGTTFECHTEDMCGFNVAGPKSRELLQRMTNTSLATGDFAFMRSKMIDISGVRCLALRVSFTGDLGWELHCKTEDQEKLYRALLEVRQGLWRRPRGRSRADVDAGGKRLWFLEPGIQPRILPATRWASARSARCSKDFLHKEAVAKVMAEPTREELVLIHIDEEATNASNADATGGEPIFFNGKGVGRVTSGTYGYTVGMSLALGYVKSGHGEGG